LPPYLLYILEILWRDEDDAGLKLRLRAIMTRYAGPLKRSEWADVARELGNFPVPQVMQRWHSFLRPELDQSDFSVEERRALAKVGLTHLGHWRRIAELRTLGKVRSPLMLKRVMGSIFGWLQMLGVNLKTERDAVFGPDRAFFRGR